MKINYGDIGNNETKSSKDIIVGFGIPIKKLLTGLLPIGCGIVYLMVASFKSGADGFYRSETKTLNDLGLMSPAFTDKEINDLSGKWKL